MLMLLLGFGKGLQNGSMKNFENDAANSIWFHGGQTSMGYNGVGPGRKIRFENEDRDMVSRQTGVDKAGSRQTSWQSSISYKNNATTAEICWIHPDYRYLEQLIITSGRFLNQKDYDEETKVVCVGKAAVELLFDKGEQPLEKYIVLNGAPFKVIGTFEDPGGDRDNRRLYIPVTTGQKAFNGGNHTENIQLLTSSTDPDASKVLEEKVTSILQKKYNISPDDKRAIEVWNNLESYLQVMGIFSIINIIVWVVGIMTLMAGIIGVANIMLITVKERTREIGIRKAMGATPGSILAMIMQEAVLITVASGYLGLALGVLVLEKGWILDLLNLINIPTEFIVNPSVDFRTAMVATIILIVAGTMAGLIPAIRAANINPMQAIRDE